MMKNIDLNIFQSTYPKLLPEKGRILIAEPFLQGPYFARSIILLTEHGSEGTVGFVINKSTDVYPDEVIDDLFNFSGELFIGGPVSSNTLHFIHTLGDKVPGSMRITPSISWGGDFEMIKKLINDGVADSNAVKFFAGYSGWSPGQLEHEIADNSWIVSTLDDSKIMRSDSSAVWKETLEHLGDIYKTWPNFPNNPAFN
jgi:putative transcriptional regulator